MEVLIISTCARCGKSTNLFNRITRQAPDGTKVIVCRECKDVLTEKERRQQLEIIIATAPKIKCPYCEQSFPKLTNEQYKDGVELNVLKYAIIPRWGVFIGELQGKHYVECPHCKMKVPQ